jgi:auxin responsive GH3 family protein
MDNNKLGCKRNDALQELEMLTVNAKEAQQPILSKILEKKYRTAEKVRLSDLAFLCRQRL